jgi:hypothetical protein
MENKIYIFLIVLLPFLALGQQTDKVKNILFVYQYDVADSIEQMNKGMTDTLFYNFQKEKIDVRFFKIELYDDLRDGLKIIFEKCKKEQFYADLIVILRIDYSFWKVHTREFIFESQSSFPFEKRVLSRNNRKYKMPRHNYSDGKVLGADVLLDIKASLKE